MLAAAHLHHRDRLANLAVELEVAQEDYRVGEVARVDRGVHLRAHQAVLRGDQHARHAALPEIGQHFVQLDDEELLVRHRVEIPVQAVDDHDPGVLHFHCAAHLVHEFARRKLGRVDLLHNDEPGIDMLAQRNAKSVEAAEKGVGAFIEDEERRGLAAFRGGGAEKRGDG